MKHLCFSKYFILVVLLTSSLFASLSNKSALFYYANNISYPMVGIHDYIIVNPKLTDTYQHGFKIYRDKIYARVILQKDKQKLINELINIQEGGFKNFFLDFGEDELSTKKVNAIVNYIYSKFSDAKILLHSKFILKDDLYEVLSGLVMDEKNTLSDLQIKKFKAYGLDIIKIETVSSDELDDQTQKIEALQKRGIIPYITECDFMQYGYSSKYAIKREILTLVNSSAKDGENLIAHRAGALPLEYLGYIQKLHDVSRGLPDINSMDRYAGVVIWLESAYENAQELVTWLEELDAKGIKFVFAGNFGFYGSPLLLSTFDISLVQGKDEDRSKKSIFYKDSMIGYEIDPSVGFKDINIHPKHAESLLVYKDTSGDKSVPVAITTWGGYAIGKAFIANFEGEQLWVVNPFTFFAKALRLKKIPVPDTTTHNAKRVLFTRIDSNGMEYRAESNNLHTAGDIIRAKIFSQYKLPYSILMPSTKTLPLSAKSVEYAVNEKELSAYKNIELLFWSENYASNYQELKDLAQNNINNINGGNTRISNTNPWLSLISPLAIERGRYYQVYSGALDDTHYTNYWREPFWGYKRVVETFKHTEIPRRLKPIDINYHAYSGSKVASLNALKYVYNWSLSQDVYPLFTSEYISTVMDYYVVSIANEGNSWLVDGMQNLKTLRFENKTLEINMVDSSGLYGYKKFKDRVYVNLDKRCKHLIKTSKKRVKKKKSYLISSNAKVIKHILGKKREMYKFEGYLDVALEFYLGEGCSLKTKPKASLKDAKMSKVFLLFKNEKKVRVDVICK